MRIRASLVDVIPLCNRRAAAIGFPDLVKGWGYKLRDTPISIGRLLGTAVHTGSERWWTDWMKTGTPSGPNGAVDAALDELSDQERRFRDILIYDRSTPELADAEKTTRHLMHEFHRVESSFDEQPAIVEGALAMSLGQDSPHEITGTVDLFMLGNGLYDRKSGSRRPTFGGQGGQYSRLLRGQGHEVKKVVVGWGPRQRQPKPVEMWSIPQATAEQEADTVVRHFLRDLEEFQQTGDARAFVANPACYLCSEKYCPAYGTNWCNAWKLKGQHS